MPAMMGCAAMRVRMGIVPVGHVCRREGGWDVSLNGPGWFCDFRSIARKNELLLTLKPSDIQDHFKDLQRQHCRLNAEEVVLLLAGLMASAQHDEPRQR
jgi:hypothetical protein